MSEEIKTKKCARCEEIKIVSEFFKMRNSKDGYHYYCKRCSKEKSKESYQRNRLKTLAAVKSYQDKNKDKISKKRKELRKNDGDRIRAMEKISRDNNIEAHRECSRNYYHNNKDVVREKRRVYEKKRYKHDLDYRFRRNARRRILHALQNQDSYKEGSTVSLLGCTIHEAREHIEKSFTDNMSWNNMGKWEIDHIIPCASFDLTDPEQQKKCFHYSNLQALWAKDNKVKGNKIL